MLKTLTVWNFALIEYIQVEFSAGLNILTGETGAGKSILIDAVGLILGERASADSIRSGSDWLRVEGVFNINNNFAISSFIQENGLMSEGDDLIISRQITRSGKNIIRINGCQVTRTILRNLAGFLIDIHGQHENQALLRLDNQLALLDNYSESGKASLKAYQEKFSLWQQAVAELVKNTADSRTYEQRIDMLKWQVDEIANANLVSGEDEALEAQIKVLANAEKISNSVQRSYDLLENGVKGSGGILAMLVDVKKNIEVAARYDEKIASWLTILADVSCQLQECSYEIRDYGESLDYSPTKLNRLQERMDVIYKLRKKYGATIDEVLAHHDRAKQELADIENYDERIVKLKEAVEQAERELSSVAENLTRERQHAAKELSAAICQHLYSLGMPNAQFYIAIEPLNKPTGHGNDNVQMMFSANLGEVPRSMQKVASGGELSRIALAIKAVGAARDSVDVMIFDEIDTGIGGRTAQMVAERIAMVAVHRQVLCITHLPQIACMADSHLYISKTVSDNKTVTMIKRLSTSEQLNELARMFSGMDLTAASLDNALEMLNNAQAKKAKWR